jgi:hypothetical protein
MNCFHRSWTWYKLIFSSIKHNHPHRLQQWRSCMVTMWSSDHTKKLISSKIQLWIPIIDPINSHFYITSYPFELWHHLRLVPAPPLGYNAMLLEGIAPYQHKKYYKKLNWSWQCTDYSTTNFITSSIPDYRAITHFETNFNL